MKIMLVTDTVEFADELRALEGTSGAYDVTEVTPLNSGLEERARDSQPDIVVIKASKPAPELIAEIKHLDNAKRFPIVFISDDSSLNTMKLAAEAGVSAFAATDRGTTNLRAVFDWSRIQFNIQGRLKEKLQTAETRLADRTVIERAKGLVMKQQGADENEAYHMMRRTAMERNVTVRDVAQAVIDASTLLSKN
jgi:two-component system, response regulator / RNA-binding antiterminator